MAGITKRAGGRPRKPDALTVQQRKANYRARKKALAAEAARPQVVRVLRKGAAAAVVMARAMSAERVSWYLWNWERWSLRHKESPNGKGYPRRSMVIKTQDSSKTFEEMCAAVDRRCARAVDVLIDGMHAEQRQALNHKHLDAAWPGGDLVAAYEAATEWLARALAVRGFE